MKTRRIKGWLVKRGKTFYATWQYGGKRYCKTTGEQTRRKAEQRLDEFIRPFLMQDEARTLETVKARLEGAQAEIEAWNEERNPPLTIMQGWPAYLAAPNRPDTGPTTLVKHEGKYLRFTSWIRTAHKAVNYMRDVTEEHAEDYARDLQASGMAAATFNAHIGLLRLVWRVLKKRAKADLNPWTGIGRKRVVAAGRRELTIEELRQVCESAEGEMRLLFGIGVYTGLRLGDAATLRWSEADIERGIIRRIPMKTGRRNPKPVQVPIHPALRTMLEEARADRTGEYVLPETAALYTRDNSAVCKRVQSHFESSGIRTVKEGTGFEIETDEDGKEHKKHTGTRAVTEVGFHSLRHSFVSLCRAANVPLVVVESLVSHASPAVTRLYSHTGEESAQAAVAALPAVMGETVDRPALPTARTVSADAVADLARKLTARNAAKIKKELLAIVAA